MSIIRRGIHRQLEDEATRLIRESMVGITKHSAKSDILTPWKQKSRYRREVYVTSGTADPSVRRGIYHRSMNPTRPELNSRDAHAPSRSRGGGVTQSLQDFVDSDPSGRYW